MSFQEYIRFLMSHFMENMHTEKKNKPKVSTSHPWFGLFPFSIKLLLKNK